MSYKAVPLDNEGRQVMRREGRGSFVRVRAEQLECTLRRDKHEATMLMIQLCDK